MLVHKKGLCFLSFLAPACESACGVVLCSIQGLTPTHLRAHQGLTPSRNTRLQKLKGAFRWAAERTDASWVLKVDDDCVVRVSKLEAQLRVGESGLDAQPIVVGLIARDFHVIRTGKWADHYPHDYYPPFPLGSAGFLVSRTIVNHVASLELPLYQGEDVSLGIWLDESLGKDNVIWISSDLFARHGNCWDESPCVIGHNFSLADMRLCSSSDKASNRTHAWKVEDLVNTRRFDVIAKIIYARARLACMASWHSSTSSESAEAGSTGPGICERRMSWARYVYAGNVLPFRVCALKSRCGPRKAGLRTLLPTALLPSAPLALNMRGVRCVRVQST